MSTTRKRLRLAGVAFTVVAGVAALTACSSDDKTTGGAGSDKAPACAPAGGPVTLQYWNTVPGMDQVVALWNKDNPNIQVQVKNISNDQYGQIGNALKAGTAPELAQVGYDELPDLRTQDAFVDASACADAKAAESKFVPWTWSRAASARPGCSRSRRTPARWRCSCAPTCSPSTT